MRTLIVALGLVAWAATRTVTLTPPAALTDLRSIRIEPSNCPSISGTTCAAPAAVVTIDACAKDSVSGIEHCAIARVVIPYTNTNLQAVTTAAINAWAAKAGY